MQETMLIKKVSEMIPPEDALHAALGFPEAYRGSSSRFKWLKIFIKTFHEMTHCSESYHHTAFRSKHMLLYWLTRNKHLATADLWNQIAASTQARYEEELDK